MGAWIALGAGCICFLFAGWIQNLMCRLANRYPILFGGELCEAYFRRAWYRVQLRMLGVVMFGIWVVFYVSPHR